MSIKFRHDGAVFPTEVKDGNLIIHMGDNKVEISFKFLKRDFNYDATYFPTCNIMCYLADNEGYIIMRFDGSVTIFNKDNIVTGFTSFNIQDIYDKTIYLPIGAVKQGKDITKYHRLCTLYGTKDGSNLCLECIGDPEPIFITLDENPLYVRDIAKGNRYFPRLKKIATNVYGDVDDDYIIHGSPIKNTGYVML